MVSRVWRILMTGVCFAVFGVGGLLLATVVLPLVRLCSADEAVKVRRSRYLVHVIFRYFVKLMALVGVISFDLEQAEKELARQKGKVIVANHPTLIDVVVIVSILPHAVCIVKEELWRNFFLKGVVKSTGYIKNSADFDALVSEAGKALAAGYSLLIFPEGTRSVPGREIRMQRGASQLALRCEADLVLLLIECSPLTLGKGEKWYDVPPTKAHFTLKFMQELPLDAFVSGGKPLPLQARQLTRFLESYYRGELQAHAGT